MSNLLRLTIKNSPNLSLLPCRYISLSHSVFKNTEHFDLDKESQSSTPVAKTTLNRLDKYLVYKYSNVKYESIKDVPDTLNASQVNYARDMGRSRIVIASILMTIVISLIVIETSKYLKRNHWKSFESEINAKHAEYSKHHQEAIKSTYK